ncbi:MAG: hypothetical protein RL185_127 [Bacteroidota bacterium]
MNITYTALLEQVKTYDPSTYQATRNYTNGAITAWSPYISRGFLSPIVVMEELKNKYSKQAWMGLMQQMAWREYFQRVWQNKGDLILEDLKSVQSNVVLQGLPSPINEALTGIHAMDEAIADLYNKGYLHNHLRMYIAMLHTNIFKAAWLPGAKWMYAHLLDHDPAANFLSWQWVAGTFSSKQYVANQENINKYTNTKQLNTFLDTEYENLPHAIFDAAGQLKSKYSAAWKQPLDEIFEIDTVRFLEKLQEQNKIEPFDKSKLDQNLAFCIYNSFNLDPLWHANEKANRILLIEPVHFAKFPIAENVLQFIIDLGISNITNLQIFVGSFEELKNSIDKSATEKMVKPVMYFKEHPTTFHYKGIQEERDWLFPEVTGYYPSFFGYWKKCERFLK